MCQREPPPDCNTLRPGDQPAGVRALELAASCLVLGDRVKEKRPEGLLLPQRVLGRPLKVYVFDTRLDHDSGWEHECLRQTAHPAGKPGGDPCPSRPPPTLWPPGPVIPQASSYPPTPVRGHAGASSLYGYLSPLPLGPDQKASVEEGEAHTWGRLCRAGTPPSPGQASQIKDLKPRGRPGHVVVRAWDPGARSGGCHPLSTMGMTQLGSHTVPACSSHPGSVLLPPTPLPHNASVQPKAFWLKNGHFTQQATQQCLQSKL